MKIKVLKTVIASKDETGTKIFEYEAGEVYNIYQELAEVFISQGWGVAEEIETQEIKDEIEIETQEEEELEIETQELEIEIETQEEEEEEEEEIEIETQDFPKKNKPKKNKPKKEKEKDAN